MGHDAMYRFAVLLLVVVLSTSHAVGAIVEFTLIPWYGDLTMKFEVTVIPEVEGGFDSADMLFGSDYGLVMLDFEYSLEWRAAFLGVTQPVPVGIYPFQDLWISGYSLWLNDIPSLFAGILTVGPAGPVYPPWCFGVDGNRDGFSSLGQQGVPDYAYGRYVTPEPTTVGLLAVAALAVLRRPTRRT